MASKSKMASAKRAPKFSTRLRRRCKLCGRPRAVYRKFGICRICFRKLADQGAIPGVRNAVRVERPHVEVSTSKVKRGLADVLKREGYIWDWSEVETESNPVKQ